MLSYKFSQHFRKCSSPLVCDRDISFPVHFKPTYLACPAKGSPGQPVTTVASELSSIIFRVLLFFSLFLSVDIKYLRTTLFFFPFSLPFFIIAYLIMCVCVCMYVCVFCKFLVCLVETALFRYPRFCLCSMIHKASNFILQFRCVWRLPRLPA